MIKPVPWVMALTNTRRFLEDPQKIFIGTCFGKGEFGKMTQTLKLKGHPKNVSKIG